ncbi:MAG TPA: hypothetical protein ENK83_00345, partial [Aliiroseovarius sp.]|nr:hypothetical protein [Aliiroseovarius sp.]
MLFSDEKLVGICDLTLDGESINDTACALDLSTGRMMVQAGPPDLPSLNARFRSNAEINNIRLQTPYGEAVCDKAEAPLISSTRGGGAWIGATALTRLFERENKHFPKVTFVFNAPLAFAWPNQSSEIILTPGFDTGGAFEIPEFGTFNGRKQTVSVLDAENVEEELLLSAVSLAIGAPVRMLAKTFKGKLTLMLNTHRPELQARTLFLSHKGDGYRDRDMVREGIKGVVAHSLKYLRALDEPQRIMAMDATRVFLEGRANRVAIELKLLALVRFLEWF